MDWHVASHTAGALGDALNLLGSWILARDVLSRDKHWTEQKELEDFADHFAKAGIPTVYKDIKITDPGAIALAMISRTVRRGKVGFTILAAGFFCLLVYHGIELGVALTH
jgi:hypothetical protein